MVIVLIGKLIAHQHLNNNQSNYPKTAPQVIAMPFFTVHTRFPLGPTHKLKLHTMTTNLQPPQLLRLAVRPWDIGVNLLKKFELKLILRRLRDLR